MPRGVYVCPFNTYTKGIPIEEDTNKRGNGTVDGL